MIEAVPAAGALAVRLEIAVGARLGDGDVDDDGEHVGGIGGDATEAEQLDVEGRPGRAPIGFAPGGATSLTGLAGRESKMRPASADGTRRRRTGCTCGACDRRQPAGCATSPTAADRRVRVAAIEPRDVTPRLHRVSVSHSASKSVRSRPTRWSSRERWVRPSLLDAGHDRLVLGVVDGDGFVDQHHRDAVADGYRRRSRGLYRPSLSPR